MTITMSVSKELRRKLQRREHVPSVFYTQFYIDLKNIFPCPEKIIELENSYFHCSGYFMLLCWGGVDRKKKITESLSNILIVYYFQILLGFQ